jgi:hypothetical protein
MCRSWAARGSWLSSSSRRIAANGSPGRAMTLSSIECETAKLDVSVSGSAATSRSKVGSPQDTKPSGGLRLTSLRSFLGSSPALAFAFSFSTTWSGACTTTVPAVSNPARPARPAIWWNTRAVRRRVRCPSYMLSAVTSTVRIGTLLPTPSGSVPQITVSSPASASGSTSVR